MLFRCINALQNCMYAIWQRIYNTSRSWHTHKHVYKNTCPHINHQIKCIANLHLCIMTEDLYLCQQQIESNVTAEADTHKPTNPISLPCRPGPVAKPPFWSGWEVISACLALPCLASLTNHFPQVQSWTILPGQVMHLWTQIRACKSGSSFSVWSVLQLIGVFLLILRSTLVTLQVNGIILLQYYPIISLSFLRIAAICLN